MSTSTADHIAEQGMADRFALVRRIADDLAHELKNPLNAMVINLEVLRTRVRAENAESALERLDVLEQETRRLHGLLDHVLRLLRPEPAGDGTFPLEPLLTEVGSIAAVLAKLSRRGFELRPVPADVVVTGRREPLRFALLTLAQAAIAGLPGEECQAVVDAVGGPEEVSVTLYAPPAAASRLQAALPAAARLLAEDGIPVGTSLDESGCRVRMVLARAAL